MQPSIFRHAVTPVLVLLMSAGVALAEKNPPKGSTPTDPQVIAKLFNGKTSYWNRGGHAY